MRSAKKLSRRWGAYERAQFEAHGAKDIRRLTELAEVRARIISEIESVGGLLLVCNVVWLDGEPLEPGERIEYRPGPTEKWRTATVGRYAARLIFDDGKAVLLLDVPDIAEARRP